MQMPHRLTAVFAAVEDESEPLSATPHVCARLGDNDNPAAYGCVISCQRSHRGYMLLWDDQHGWAPED